MAKGEIKIEKKIQLKENEVLMPDGKVIGIKPVKIRFMINKDFLNYQVIEQIGIVEIFGYDDGFGIIKRFLISVFDNEEYVNSIIDDLDVGTIENIIKISKKVNKIKDDELKNVMMNLEEGV
jgi:hypothetical protein